MVKEAIELKKEAFRDWPGGLPTQQVGTAVVAEAKSRPWKGFREAMEKDSQLVSKTL